MPWSRQVSVASLGGAGVLTEGAELATLDSAGATRNVLDDGSGNATVAGTIKPSTLATGVISVAQPAVPASTVALANPTGVDCVVYVAGGTVTVVAINGVATGLTSGAFYVSAGATITLTYSVAPTWVWVGI